MQTFWSQLVNAGRRITERALTDITSLAQWQKIRDERRREFMEMVGLGSPPPRGDLNARRLGVIESDGYRIEKIAFQSLPGVGVTANLYIPNGLKAPAPAVLYPCGHAANGLFHYQYQGEMWARRGYVCLIFNTMEQADSVEAGGDHHGIYYERNWDWISRGYAASGGELWNSLRALDYLLSRREVDSARVGVTGISGGGALSWWVAIADERVAASAPFCGTSTMGSYVADRTLNGHCDCMLYHNVFERDMAEIGALIAPRPLLVGSARHDTLFHKESCREVVRGLKKIYALYGCPENVTICEYDGGHGYSPAGYHGVEKWFDRHVAGDKRPLLLPAPKKYKDWDLSVLEGAPSPTDRVGRLPELLSSCGRITYSKTEAELAETRRRVVAELRRTTFRHFPAKAPALSIDEVADWGSTRIYDFSSDPATRLRVLLYKGWEKKTTDLVLAVMSPGDRAEELAGTVRNFHTGPVAVLEPRGTGPLSWHPSQEWLLTRAALLTGRTPESVRLWDIVRGFEAVQQIEKNTAPRIFLYGHGNTAVLAIYAALLNEDVAGVLGDSPPFTHATGPYLLGVLRTLDIPQATGLLAPRPVGLAKAAGRQFYWATTQYARLGIANRIILSHTMQHVARNALACPTARPRKPANGSRKVLSRS